jgi:ACS family sodium-dependent inorganic phosphate cotransporter-like MFS transporter 5
LFIGKEIGVVITTPIAGILCASNFLGGWPAAFYVFGKKNNNDTIRLLYF